MKKRWSSTHIIVCLVQTVCGTPYFIAPEILEEGHETYGAEVDVWSLGVIIYFMLCGYAFLPRTPL